jgi:hypothetical protein
MTPIDANRIASGLSKKPVALGGAYEMIFVGWGTLVATFYVATSFFGARRQTPAGQSRCHFRIAAMASTRRGAAIKTS